jgi:hypothetical protein
MVCCSSLVRHTRQLMLCVLAGGQCAIETPPPPPPSLYYSEAIVSHYRLNRMQLLRMYRMCDILGEEWGYAIPNRVECVLCTSLCACEMLCQLLPQ